MAKGNSVELKTFKSYGVDEILGFKTEEKDGRQPMWTLFDEKVIPPVARRLKGTQHIRISKLQ